jgi:1-aminocyclopropane-1-carboxylate deaminase
MILKLEKSRVDPLSFASKYHTTADVLRLDFIHPVISGNKWFKLHKYLEDAEQTGKKVLITYGGAFSNHIIATAAAAHALHLLSVGIIRGERPRHLSHTLQHAISYGMELVFISREQYKTKELPAELLEKYNSHDLYLVPEGGYGIKGMEGAAAILKEGDFCSYTHIIAAVGTGTMLAGLVQGSDPDQIILGISVLKNNFSLQGEINTLLPFKKQDQFEILHDYHFGGYAKYNQELIHFMNHWYQLTSIPSDFVYTGKLFYGVHDLIQKSFFPPDSRILIIHSGGLQGNESLPKGTLIF